MGCGNGKCDVMEMRPRGNTMNARDKIKARTNAVQVGSDACGCAIERGMPTPPPRPPVVTQVPKKEPQHQPMPVPVPVPVPPKVEPKPQPTPPVPVPVPGPVPPKVEPKPQPTPPVPGPVPPEMGPDCNPNSLWAQRNPEEFIRLCGGNNRPTPVGTPVLTRMPPTTTKNQCDDPAWVAAHDVTGELCGGHPAKQPKQPVPFTPPITALLNVPSNTPTDAYCQQRLRDVYQGDVARMMREDELCGATTSTRKDPQGVPVPSSVTQKPVAIGLAKPIDPTATSKGIGRDKVKTRASSGASPIPSVDTRFANPERGMQLHGMPVAPKVPNPVHGLGFINVEDGAQIFRGVLQGGQWVPGENITANNGRWVRMRSGNAAYLVEHHLLTSEVIVVASPRFGYAAINVDPNGPEVLDGIAYVDMTPSPIGAPPSLKGNAPATGCGGWRVRSLAAGDERYGGASGTAPAGCPGGCGSRSGCLGGCTQAYNNGAPGCSGGKRSAYTGCKQALEPLWVHGPGYASATGVPAGWAANVPHDVAHARNMADCQEVGVWNGTRCSPFVDAGSEGLDKAQSDCEAAGNTWRGNKCLDADGNETGGDNWTSRNTGQLIEGIGRVASEILRAATAITNSDNQRAVNIRIAELRSQADAISRDNSSTEDRNAGLRAILEEMRAIANRNNIPVSDQPPKKDNTALYAVGAIAVLGAAYMISQRKKSE